MRSKEVSTSKVDQGCFTLRGSRCELFLIRIVNTGIQEGKLGIMSRFYDKLLGRGWHLLLGSVDPLLIRSPHRRMVIVAVRTLAILPFYPQ